MKASDPRLQDRGRGNRELRRSLGGMRSQEGRNRSSVEVQASGDSRAGPSSNTMSVVARCRNLRVEHVGRLPLPRTSTSSPQRYDSRSGASSFKRWTSGCPRAARGRYDPHLLHPRPAPTSGLSRSLRRWLSARFASRIAASTPSRRIAGWLVRSGLSVQSAVGWTRKPGTSTYSRFSCDIRAGTSGRIGGRIAVWPTGPTTLRWQII